MAERANINHPDRNTGGVDSPGIRVMARARSALLGAFGSVVALLVIPSTAETLRVTTWNLGSGLETNAAAFLEEAAGTLKNLDPDVILLQRVRDWHMCAQLAEALKPLEYHVAICSAFRGDSPMQPPN